MAMTDEQARAAEFYIGKLPKEYYRSAFFAPHQWRNFARFLIAMIAQKDDQIRRLQNRVMNLERDKKDLIRCVSVMGDALPHNEIRFAREILEDRGARGGGIFEDFQRNQIVVQFDRG
jgi:hypothetical protein